MGKTGKWIKSFFTGSKKEKDKEKEKEKENNRYQSSPLPAENGSSTPIAATTSKEKKRWSFRRSSASRESSNSISADPVAVTPSISVSKELSSAENIAVKTSISASFEAENEQKKRAIAVATATATAAAAEAAVSAAQAASAFIRLTVATPKTNPVEEAAAIKIQSVFRSYLAKKALNALKGLVKLQALVRGHLVRKQATATLRCMQALLTVQARARAQRLRLTDESHLSNLHRQPGHRRSPQDNRFKQSYDADRGMEVNIKIVEMDLGESRGSFKNSYSNPQFERVDHRLSTYYTRNGLHPKLDYQLQVPPSPSALTDLSPRTCSAHFDEYSYATAQSSPQCFSAFSRPDPTNFTFPQQEYADDPLFPNYMAKTESSKAKARSQSAPKQRPDSYERQTSKRRPSVEGRNIPRGVRMQRSSSHVGAAINGYHYPWSIKLDRSTVSLKDSECGSTSTVLTNTNYCRSLVGFEVLAIPHSQLCKCDDQDERSSMEGDLGIGDFPV